MARTVVLIPPTGDGSDRLQALVLELTTLLDERLTNYIMSAAYLLLAANSLRFAIRFHQSLAAVYFLIHLLVAVLFLVRYRTTDRSPYPLGYVAAILATFYVYLYDYTKPTAIVLGRMGPAVTLFGTVVSCLSVLSLGRRFGILPSYRGIQTRFMYRVVRHPIYASYVIMDIGLILGYLSPRNVAIFAVAIALFVVRIHYEELLLARDADYVAYTRHVKWRLIPWVY